MKILIITSILPPEIGGPASYVPQIVKRLGKGYQFRATTFTSAPGRIPGVEIFALSQKGGTIFRQGRLFLEVLKNVFWADVFYLMDPLVVGLPPGIIGLIFRKPVVIRFVGYQPWEELLASGKTEKFLDQFLANPDGGVKSRLYILATILALRLAKKIVVPSRYLATVLQKYFAVRGKKVVHVYNAFAIGKVERREKAKTKTAVSIGRLIFRKRVDWTVEAVARYTKNTGKYLRLLVVGDGPDRRRIEKGAEGLGKKYKIEPFVQFLGQKSWRDGLSILSGADVYLLTSVYEGLPFAVLEALELGVPVVATDVAGTDEVAIDGQTAITAKPGDTEKMAYAIDRLLSDKTLARRLIRTGQEMIAREFAWRNNLVKTREVFQSALG